MKSGANFSRAQVASKSWSDYARKASRRASWKLVIAALVLTGAGLACALSPRDATGPLFIAPGGVNYPDTTPVSVSSGGLEASVEAPVSTAEPVEIPVPTASAASPLEENQDPPGVDPTVEEVEEPALLPTATFPLVDTAPILYYTQAGDTLPVVAVRFGVSPDEITSPAAIPPTALLNPNQLLIIPNRLPNTTSSQHLMPDSEVVFSPSAIEFDVAEYVDQAGGYLSEYWRYLGTTGVTRGPDIVSRVAIENSINPRLLLALLEYQSGWVYGKKGEVVDTEYMLGEEDPREKGLYKQLAWALNQLSEGYYGWREGRLAEIRFSDGVTARLAPDLNAGTAALQYYFAQHYDSQGWVQALDEATGFPALYEEMFGNPWVRAQGVEPLYPPDLVQPSLILPFAINQVWGFTGGPHGAWERDGAWAAVDFAPGSLQPGCNETNTYAVAAAAGLVTRSENSIVTIDLDGDGREQTGWVLMYLHVGKKERIAAGSWVEAGDRLGHPSCEGGLSTGTHIHLARKYNGEWIVADGPLPFVLSGWTVHAGDKPYAGTMTRGDQVITASVLSPSYSQIMRNADDP